MNVMINLHEASPCGLALAVGERVSGWCLRVAVGIDVKGSPSFIDLEEAGSRLPSSENDHSRVVPGVVDRAVDVADHAPGLRLRAVSTRRCGTLAGAVPHRKGACGRCSTRGAASSARASGCGIWPKPEKNRAALQQRLPGAPGPEQMAVHACAGAGRKP